MLQQPGRQPAMMRCLFLLVVAASSAVASAQKLTKVAAIQMSMSTSMEANVDKALNLVAEAADDGAKIIVLPELFAARYFAIEENPKWYAIAEPLANNSRLDKFAALAKDRGVVAIYPFYEVAANGATHYDSAAVIDADGTVLGAYGRASCPRTTAGSRSTTSRPARRASRSGTRSTAV